MKKILALLLMIGISQAYATTVPVGQVVYPAITVSAGGTQSATVLTNGMSLVGCQIPAGMTSTSLSFVAATVSSGPFQELDNSSGKLSYTIAGGKWISITPTDFYGVQYFKIVPNQTESATRSLICTLKGI